MKMRAVILFLLLALGINNMALAGKLPKNVGKARASAVSILVYKDGNLLRSGTGVFAGGKGEIYSSYSLFIGCDSAVAISPDGRVRPVSRILGADELYDCIKVRVDWDKKIASLPSASGTAPEDVLYLVSYGAKKSGTVECLNVVDVDTVSGKPYYTFAFAMQERYLSAPVVNSAGELVALMQPSAKGDTLRSYAVSAALPAELAITPLNYNGSMFRNMGIPRALPASQKEALTCLYLLQGYAYTAMRDKYLSVLDEYTALFPDSYEGHIMRAEYLALADTAFDAARKEWDRALRVADKPDDVLFNISKVYSSAMVEHATDSIEAQAFVDSALVYIDKALAVRNEPIYIQRKAELLSLNGNYEEAYECYSALSNTVLRCADVFIAAAGCKEAVGDYDAAIAQMDSAVACAGGNNVAAASCIVERALLKRRAGRAREAVMDYNLYEKLRGGSLNARFYYLREQAEYDAKMFKQALDDLDRALALVPGDVGFMFEKARVCYRVKMVDEAVALLDEVMRVSPENPDVHYLLGRCHMFNGENEKAKASLQKALEYGHPDAEERLRALQ